MKNILKSASLLIITIAAILTFKIDVNADVCMSQYGLEDSNECRVGERGVIIVAGNGFKYRPLSYATSNTRDKVGTSLYKDIGVDVNFNNVPGNYIFSHYKDSYSSLFCLDAQYEGGSAVLAERFLLDTSESKKVQVFDAAVMSVLVDSGIHTGGTGNSDYWARLMAIRALTYTFGFYQTANLDFMGAFYAGQTVAHNWNSFYSSEVAAVNAALAEIGGGSIGGVPLNSSYNYTGDTVNSGASYYVKALRAAVEKAKTLKSQPNLEVGNSNAGEIETTGGAGNFFVKKDVVHTIKISGFSKQNKFVINSNGNNGIKFVDGTKYDGLTAYISQIEISGGAVLSKEQIPFDKDLVELGYIPENKDVEIKITAHFEGWRSSTDPNIVTLKCGQSPIKYYIDGTYGTGEDAQFGDYIGTIWYSGEKEKQRYIGIEKVTEKRESEGTPWKSSYETKLIESCSCEDLEESCSASGNPNSVDCVELKHSNCGCPAYEVLCELGDEAACKQYEDECENSNECSAQCDAYFDTFECCDEKGDLIVSTADDHEVSILGPGENNPNASSVKVCFVNNVDCMAESNGDGEYKNNAGVEGVKDQKENTYTLADMKSNTYCTVSCKEDYVMTMPTAKLVNAGRYFTFKAKVDGTKICYTNTIDRDRYNRDVLEAQKAIIEAYNTYKNWEKASQAAKEEDHADYATSASPGTCSCGYGYEDFLTGAHTETYTYQYYYITSESIENGTLTGYMGTNRDSKLIKSEISSHSAGSTSGSPCTPQPDGSCTGGCESTECTTYTLDEPKGIPELQEYIDEEKDKALSALISAQQHYKNVLKEYDDCSNGWESEINYDPEVYYDYSEDDYMEMLKNHMGDMDKEVKTKNTSSWYCNSNVSSNGHESTKGQISDQNYEQCNTSNNGYKDTSINYVYCEPNGVCKVTPEKVSNARYKKITSGVTANYKPSTLFYNVYPTGEITVNKADDNVALENKLPVALNRERGIYKYTVNMKKLGEFYDQAPKSNLGRYVGSNTAVVDPSTLEYNCSYLVNITKTTGWVCDFDDDCVDDCIANCIGPNCDDYCDGNDCVADCIGLGCIYDSGAGSSLLEKIVSLNNLFPNGTDSYNWDANRNDKARMTVSAIEEKGNSIYDEEPILSITLTPSSAKEIRKYNNDVIDDGGYSNKTVSCENRSGFEQIACYSSFIDDLLAGDYGNIVNENSLIAEESYRHGSSGYFELWGNAVSEDNMIGPAWK